MLGSPRVALALGALLLPLAGCAGHERAHPDAAGPSGAGDDADVAADASALEADASVPAATSAADASSDTGAEAAPGDAGRALADAAPADAASTSTDAIVPSGPARAEWHTFHGAMNEHDVVSAVALAPDDSIYVIGKSEKDWSGPLGQAPLSPYLGSAGVYVLKLSAEGAYQWHGFYAGHAWDHPSSAVVGPDGNLYVAGTGQEAWQGPGGKAPLNAYAGGRDILVFSLAPDGGFRWHTFLGGAPPERNDSAGNEEVNAIAVDTSGALYVVGEAMAQFNGVGGAAPLRGESLALSGFTSECFVLKLRPDGAYVWHTLLGGGPRDSCQGVDVDAQGQIFLAGTSFGSWYVGSQPLQRHSNYLGGVQTEQEDIFVASLNPDGRPAWHTFLGSTFSDVGGSIRVGPDGALYVESRSSGSFRGPAGQAPLYDGYAERDTNLISGARTTADVGYQIALIKLTKAGAYQWHARFGDSVTWPSLAFEHGRILLAASADVGWNGPAGQPPRLPHAPPIPENYATSGMLISIDPQGAYAWHSFTGLADSVELTGVAVDSRGQIVAAGMSSKDWSLNGRAPLHPHAGDYQDALLMKLNAPP